MLLNNKKKCGAILLHRYFFGNYMKYLKIFFVLLVILVLFYACGKKGTNIPTAEQQTIIETESQSENTTAVQTTAAATTKPVVQQTQVPETTEGQKSSSEITFDTNNKFIQAVVNKYGIASEGLVCIYDKNKADNNYVFQFDGSKDKDGKDIRTGDTLKYVYTVTGDCKKVCRAGGLTGNDGLTSFEGMAIITIAKQAFLPYLQDQINAG